MFKNNYILNYNIFIDYNLCVMIALFRKLPTVIFLTITFTLLAAVFMTVVIIEKNLELDPNVETAKSSQALEVKCDSQNSKAGSGSNDTSSLVEESHTHVILVKLNNVKLWMYDNIKPLRILSNWWASVRILPQFKKKISLQSLAVKFVLPLSYASIGVISI